MTPWTVTLWDSLSLEFSRKEYWSGLLFPSLILKDMKVTLNICTNNTTHSNPWKCEEWWMGACSVMSKCFAILWTVACQALLSMEFSRQEYWSGSAFPSPGHLLYRQADSLPLESHGKPLESSRVKTKKDHARGPHCAQCQSTSAVPYLYLLCRPVLS